MATIANRTICATCNIEKLTYRCQGCSKTFCFEDLAQHRKDLSQQLNQFQNDHNKLRQNLNDHTNDAKVHSLIQQINAWERDSIQKIQHIAQQCRERWVKYSHRFLRKLDKKLNDVAQLSGDMQKQENEFNELDLNQLKQKLYKLQEELRQPPNVSIKKQSTVLINNIYLRLPFGNEVRWEPSATTIAGTNGKDKQLDQLLGPSGVCLDDNQNMYIADWGNHRIMQWKSNSSRIGVIAAGENGQGTELDRLNQPTDVILDPQDNSLIIADRWNRRVIRWTGQVSSRQQILISDIDCWGITMHEDGSLYVSDCIKNEVRRWKKGEKQTTIVAGGNGQGKQLKQLDNPRYLFVDDNHNLYVSDTNNHRVMKWRKSAQEGIVVAGGNGPGAALTQLSSPEGVIVDQFGQIYVADFENHRVMRWCEGEDEGIVVVGGRGKGQQANQLNGPRGLSCDDKGSIYVADCVNNRIQKFDMKLD